MAENNDKRIIADDDWKQQAQREKEELESKEEHEHELPPASFLTLVNSLVVQILFFMGKLNDPRGGAPQVNLDMAKHHIDILQMLEEKTKGNLTPEEAEALALALHEVRMQYVQMASY